MIRFESVSKVYDDGTTAVDSLDLEVPTGTLLALVGPSGCGKTTSLRMINRLIDPTTGTITLDGMDVLSTDRVTLRRKIGYVIQHAGLFPHRTVVDNVAALPRLLGGDRKKTRARALELLETVGLDERFANRYPWQLSGGQQQRVGVARALATDPPFLLMDEPFSAVDPIVRAQLQDEFLRLQGEIGKTIVMVTHDIDEALKLGDRVAVLRTGGVLAQFGTPLELLTQPVDTLRRGLRGGRTRLSGPRLRATPGPHRSRPSHAGQARRERAGPGLGRRGPRRRASRSAGSTARALRRPRATRFTPRPGSCPAPHPRASSSTGRWPAPEARWGSSTRTGSSSAC